MARGPTKKYYIDMNDNYAKGSLTCLKHEVFKARAKTDFPLVLNIEPTNDCNSKCYFCPRDRTVKTKGISYLDIDNYRDIIDQTSPHKMIMLNLHKDGEPLLNKYLPDMVEYAKYKDAAEVVHLNTNGLLINSEVGRGIIERGIDDITISVDAAREETYRKLKKLKNLKKLEENIKNALEYREKIQSHTKIRVKIMEFDDIDSDEIELFFEKWSDIADEVQVTGIHNWSGAIDNLRVTDEQSVERYPCWLLWYMLAINSNGDVSICCVDWNHSAIVGNIRKHSVNEIWNGDKIKKIRRAHLDGRWNAVEVCADCSMWAGFGNLWNYLKTRKEFI